MNFVNYVVVALYNLDLNAKIIALWLLFRINKKQWWSRSANWYDEPFLSLFIHSYLTVQCCKLTDKSQWPHIE